MPARSTRVTLHNRTPFTLTLTNSGLDHGDWTPGGWTPPPSIAPGTTVGWQSESGGDIPIVGSIGTGTEGHVKYGIEGTGQRGWQGPQSFGDPHLLPGAPVAMFQQSANVFTALTVDRKGALNVAWLDLSNQNGWQGPQPFGDPHLSRGASVAVFQQSPNVFTALTVDTNGALNVAWLDLSNQNGWQGPQPFGDPHLSPGAPIAVFQQSATVFTALTVDRNGALNVAWLDLNNQQGWQGPQPFGDPHLSPGAPIAVFQQSPTVFTALTVDRNRALNVAWLDLSDMQGWHGPQPFGDPHLSRGAPVAVFQQSATVFTALTVDNNGALNVAWLDLSNQRGWQGPQPFGDPHLSRGAPVAVFQQSTTVFTALTVDRNGALNVAWLDLSNQNGWQGPQPFGDPHLSPGAPIAVFQQSPTVFTALTVDRSGALNVAWLDLSNQNGWQGPQPFGDPHLLPGAPVAVFQQSANVFTALTVDNNRALNVAWLDLDQGLYIYWDNPFIGLNRYHQSVMSGFGISFSGGKGNNTEAVYTLQTDEAVFVPRFRPSVNGFPFSNSWPSETLAYIELPPFNWWGNGIAVGDASNGLCGGMTFAVRDYFDNGQWPAWKQPSGAGDPVFDYLVRRLFDSFNSPVFGSCEPFICGGYNFFADVVDFQTQMDPLYPDSDNYITGGLIGEGRAWIMAREAWPAIQASVDAGLLCPIGLVMVKSFWPFDLGNNHQVLAYGYRLQQQQLTIHVYDPNSPNDDKVQISLDITDTGEPISVTHNVNAPGPIYSYFVLRYSSIAPLGGFLRSVAAGLTVGKNGALNVAWLDLSDSQGWHGPQPFGDPHLFPGAPVAVFQQSANVFTALTVDNNRALNVAWLDLSDAQGWHGPQPFGDPHLFPGAPIAVIQQRAAVFAALTVDRNGALNVAWLDLSNQSGWRGPQPFGDPHLLPGAPVAMFQQSANVFTALTVDTNGALNVAWLDLSNQNGWQGPQPFGDPHLSRGASVAVFQQSPNVFTALTVDRNGALNVAWLDLSNQNGWQGPQPFGDPHLSPGAPVAVFQQSTTVFTALTVDRNRALNVAWLDLSETLGWHGPQPFGDPHLSPGAPVAVFQQSATVFAALTVDRNGALNVAWLDLSDAQGWHGPQPFGDPHLSPGAPIALFQQSGAVFSALTVDRKGALNVARLDLSDMQGWHGPQPFGDPHLLPGAPLTVFKQPG